MVTETRVKYEKITYMKYFLEQIGIKFDQLNGFKRNYRIKY